MLDKGIIERIVLNYKDIYKQVLEDNIQSPEELPYFEGDFWPNVMEENIRELEQEEEARKRVSKIAIGLKFVGIFTFMAVLQFHRIIPFRRWRKQNDLLLPLLTTMTSLVRWAGQQQEDEQQEEEEEEVDRTEEGECKEASDGKRGPCNGVCDDGEAQGGVLHHPAALGPVGCKSCSNPRPGPSHAGPGREGEISN